jgi:hypothetical protein
MQEEGMDMARGFIQDKLQLKLMVLYILNHLIEPVDMPTITDLALCDDGVDYFQLTEALAELVKTGHVELEDDRYSITKKGRTNCETCESSIPYSVRVKCDRNTGTINAVLRRNSQVQATIHPRGGEEYTVRMSLSDDTGSIISMDVMSYTEVQSKRLANNFKQHAEQIYNAILSALLADYDNKSES